jgi:excisionase family DNA binding protein
VIADDIRGGEAGQEPPATFLTPKDVQERLKIGERLTYKLLRSQAIPNVRVGNLHRIHHEDLDNALSSGAVLEVSK